MLHGVGKRMARYGVLRIEGHKSVVFSYVYWSYT
jgi:hypothetical protein